MDYLTYRGGTAGEKKLANIERIMLQIYDISNISYMDWNLEKLREFLAILKRALTEPLRQIAENAGYEGSVVLNKVLEGKGDFGFNAQTEKYENLLEAGVLDPTKVVRFAIQNAASVSGLMLTTEAMIAEKPEKKKAPAMPPGGMGEDMY